MSALTPSAFVNTGRHFAKSRWLTTDEFLSSSLSRSGIALSSCRAVGSSGSASRKYVSNEACVRCRRDYPKDKRPTLTMAPTQLMPTMCSSSGSNSSSVKSSSSPSCVSRLLWSGKESKTAWDLLASSAFVFSCAAAAAATSFAVSSSSTTSCSTATAPQQQHHVVSSTPPRGSDTGEDQNVGGTERGNRISKLQVTSFSYATSVKEDDPDLEEESDSSGPIASSSHAAYRTYNVSVQALRGKRDYMEDEYRIADDGRFAAVFDGHGGSDVSTYLKNRLYESICRHLQQRHWEETDDDAIGITSVRGGRKSIPSIASHNAAIRDAFKQIDYEVLQNDALTYMGSTAVAILLHESHDGLRTILSANVGDSRAVLSRGGKAVELTKDHKPNDEREKARLLAMGETIEWDKRDKVHRVRNLAVSRSMGDKHAKPTVSAEVDIKNFPVQEQVDEFIVIGSDGLWDVMSSQEVVSFVNFLIKGDDKRPGKSIEETRAQAAGKLGREALNRGSTDNICVVLVWLNDEEKESNSA